MEINWDLHPIQSILKLGRLGLIPRGSILLLAKYFYVPQTSTNDTRVIVPIKFEDLTPHLVQYHIETLKLGQELAIQSQVFDKHGNQRGHMLFTDCQESHDTDSNFAKWLPARWDIKSVDVYRSGRSHHLYFPAILPESEWRRFLGNMLLWNPRPGLPQFIDERWVGHALEHSYTAMRWSANSNQHKHAPVYTSTQPLTTTAPNP